MSIIKNIQNKPHAYKVRLIWLAVSLTIILMVVAWIFSANYSKSSEADTTLFRTISRGLKDIKNNYSK